VVRESGHGAEIGNCRERRAERLVSMSASLIWENSVEQFAHQLVNLPAFIITWGTFFAAGILTFSIQLYRNRQQFSFMAFVRHCFPFDIRSAKTVHMDVKIYIIRKATDFLCLIPSIACLVAVSTFGSDSLRWLLPDFTVIHPTYLIIMGCCVVVFLVGEFSDYLVHYLEHRVPFLWELHKVHHSAQFLNPLTTKRSHSLPIVYGGIASGILSGIPAGIFAFLFGFTVTDVLFLGAVMGKIGTIVTLDPLKHSHFPVSLGWLDRILISPHMHQVHHSSLEPHWDKNFGTNLSIYDWIFGTAYKPSKNEPIVYGLAGYDEVAMQQYNTLMGAYILPLLKIWRMIVPTPASTKTPMPVPAPSATRN
jgi:sterol desaturase/sphingolipid hydroxylase (fatty acid hydroxylase superfamily)